ncbi:hypothetical protein yc1106_00911 [Curvularia clavata]|uniref:Uncharacterized protein n=1 Tax=Curvularia clavata TaxID=95742 RepID=A0A9Q8Z0U9_CURCL|nr:hypothetical protein yc1106_00911 [Curvularia clavata]
MAHSDLSAKVIFSPREMKLYNRWQCLHTTLQPKERGFIPTAVEYEDFQQWLKRQDSGYFSDIFDDITGHIVAASSVTKESKSDAPVASVCQHTLHPVAAGHFQSRCPVCTIDMHVKYMHVMSQALEDAGGHPPSCTLKSSDHQDKVYNAWSKGKVSAIKELLVLEVMAEQEAKWSAKHPEEKQENVQTASKALELYWSDVSADISGCVDERPRPKKGSTVTFAPDTDFEPGRPDVYFYHNSPRYEPGKYTVAEYDDHYEDMISEDSEDYYHSGNRDVIDESEPVADEAEPAPKLLKSFQNLDKIDEIEDDDGDSDWEDAEEDEDSDEYSDDDSEGSCTYWEIDDESSFIVFGED